VLSQEEVERIHAASVKVLSSVGVKVEWKPARDTYREAGAEVDDEAQRVRIPEALVRRAVDQAPRRFALHGPDFEMEIGGGQTCFAGQGIPTETLDAETGERRAKACAGGLWTR
jgi:trimethylamine--corrinoid protein Co-methyltransferase